MKQEQNSLKKNCLFIISGPSGAGKSTIITEILKQNSNCSLSTSCTTRQPRGVEKDGLDYFFLSKEEFKGKIEEGEFLEHAKVYGNFYGTPKSFILDALKEKNVILDIDYQGMEKIKSNNNDQEIEIVTIFILPPSIKELTIRLDARKTDSPETISKRIDGAKKEIEQYKNYDYNIINYDIDQAISLVHKIINNRDNAELKNNLPNSKEIQAFLKENFFFSKNVEFTNLSNTNKIEIFV